MARRSVVPSLVLVASLLAGCGGGGGTSSPLPATGGSKTPQTVSFSLKLPGKATMARVRKPFYQSQGTQGVSIDWISNDPTHPDYAAPISFACPAATNYPAGVTNCTTDSSGDTAYTFQLAMVPGPYTLTVTTFDAAPTNGIFATGNKLAQGSIPITIAGGTSNAIPSITFEGVTANISFEPKPSQSHVVPFNSGFAVIGNAMQAFIVNPLDADGYVITGTGAPAVTVSESTNDPAQYFSITQSGATNEWDFSALQAPSSSGGYAQIDLSAPNISSTVTLTPVQELWTTQTAGGSPSAYGLTGYPLFPPSFAPGNPIDFVFDSSALPGCSPSGCIWEPAAAEPDGSIGAIGVQTYTFFEFAAPAVSEGPGAPAPGATIGGVAYPSNLAFDASGEVFITDNSAGAVSVYPSVATITSNPIASASGLGGADAITVAPSWSTIPSSLQQTIWIGDYNSSAPVAAFVHASGSTTMTPIPVSFASGAPSSVSTIGFDSNGDLWLNDGSYLTAYLVSGSSSGVTLTPIASFTPTSQALAGSSFGATAQGVMYLGQFGSYTGDIPYSVTGCPARCAITPAATAATQAPVDASIVVP